MFTCAKVPSDMYYARDSHVIIYAVHVSHRAEKACSSLLFSQLQRAAPLKLLFQLFKTITVIVGNKCQS